MRDCGSLLRAPAHRAVCDACQSSACRLRKRSAAFCKRKGNVAAAAAGTANGIGHAARSTRRAVCTYIQCIYIQSHPRVLPACSRVLSECSPIAPRVLPSAPRVLPSAPRVLQVIPECRILDLPCKNATSGDLQLLYSHRILLTSSTSKRPPARPRPASSPLLSPRSVPASSLTPPLTSPPLIPSSYHDEARARREPRRPPLLLHLQATYIYLLSDLFRRASLLPLASRGESGHRNLALLDHTAYEFQYTIFRGLVELIPPKHLSN